MPSFGGEKWSINGIEDGAVAESFPTQAVFLIQHYFKRVRLAALALAGTEQDV
jgi:hypothetical protein